jgi:TrmH family RNA methyltransferase
VAVVGQRPDDLSRIANGLVMVFDRPTSPGNIGTLIRSADAFGATGVVVTGHAADIYDPKSVRASTGSLLTLPVVRFDGYPEEVVRHFKAQVIGLGRERTGRACRRRSDPHRPSSWWATRPTA